MFGAWDAKGKAYIFLGLWRLMLGSLAVLPSRAGRREKGRMPAKKKKEEKPKAEEKKPQ